MTLPAANVNNPQYMYSEPSNRPLGYFGQSAAANVLYTVDYSDILTTGETIVSAEGLISSVTTPPITSTAMDVVTVGGIAASISFLVGGGLDGTRYAFTVRSTTSIGQVLQSSFHLSINEERLCLTGAPISGCCCCDCAGQVVPTPPTPITPVTPPTSNFVWVRQDALGNISDYGGLDVSSDGQVIFAAQTGGPGELTTNGGTSWSEVAALDSDDDVWQGVVMSANGATIAVAGQNIIKVSTDTAATWNDRTLGVPLAGGVDDSIGISDDGAKIFVVGYDGEIVTGHLSLDHGATFNTVYTMAGSHSNIFTNAAVSGDGGTLLFACADLIDGTLTEFKKSTDNGGTWTDIRDGGDGQIIFSLMISTDGQQINFVTTQGSVIDVYASIDAGASYIQYAIPLPGATMAMSGDGSVVAGVRGDGFPTFVSNTSVAGTWVLQNQNPAPPNGDQVQNFLPAVSKDGTHIVIVPVLAGEGETNGYVWIRTPA